MFSFWDSVADLRQFEHVFLLIIMIVPILCGTVVLSIRHRIKTLLTQSNESQGYTYSEHIQKLESRNRLWEKDLASTRKDLSNLRGLTAPRQLSAMQEDILLEKLRGIKAAPVIVSAYSFEEESAAYAQQIAAALRNAGWDVTYNKSSMN